ncbi:MAG: transporter substrate-binding domain-containing protein [Desulfobacteraceae bacterium]|nr:transporter substrate-binding domain-containing protein [Desulfobacteraceae bacterium]MBC2755442.1 transporter substrate-binding domain-containing protein [Desulfobacteraceae bacterium]
MLRLCTRTIIIVLVTIIVYGCTTTSDSVKDSGEVTAPEIAPLKVGITPDYPPIIFKLAKEITGVEADLAKRLAEELGRPLQFVELPWKEQIPALLIGKTDIIMSGMSITKAREVRIRFTDPYVKSGLLAAFRREDAAKYNSIDSILNSDLTIGVIKGTTGAVFAKNHCSNAGRILELSKAHDGAIDLKRGVIDLFINDAPSIIWLVSENEADLSGLWEPLNVEHLAWGITGEDQEFVMDVNDILKKWKEDGTLDKVLKRWLPYLDSLK